MTSIDLFDARRRQWLTSTGAVALGSLLGTSPLWAQNTTIHEPERGQAGKDVIWLPTPDALVTRMLRMAQVTPKDYVIDLGSGDGKIVIAAARGGAQGLGIEYNPDLVALSRQRAQEAKVADRARFEKADIFESDFSKATVITMYLLPHLNLRLRHRILALKPGTRVVSHEFRMGRWRPDETSRVGHASAHLWLVPANAGGDWEFSFPQRGGPRTVRMSFAQHFQYIVGEAAFEDFTALPSDGKLLGERLSFDLTDEDGHLRRFVGRVAGDRIDGSVYDFTANGARQPFSARRLGAAPAFEGAGPAPEDEAEPLGFE
ncbi:MAG: class I SAM-dependent methyltransferase [Pseudomonadota bacterium]|nr:class I SAM-dependent methyltransferase [Pseudomonadota bacterium]